MVELPFENKLKISQLAQSFSKTTNSYKFYWFLAILDHFKNSESSEISCNDLALKMLSLAWYPLDFYKLSFGKQDSFKLFAKEITNIIQVDNLPNSLSLFDQLRRIEGNKDLERILKKISTILKRWVLYRFLRPFFQDQLHSVKDPQINSKVKELANTNPGLSPYHFSGDNIIIGSSWKNYFQLHQHILRSFVQWHLLKFLQKNNPSIIGLSSKLEKPGTRNLKFAREYWEKYINNNDIQCIYKGGLIEKQQISLDHFIPWSYVAHDLIWNIVPTTKQTNSLKNNQIPDLEVYFEKYCKLQFDALMFHTKNSPRRLTEDFYQLLKTENFEELPYEIFKEKLKSEITNFSRSATNLGFKTGIF